MSAAKEIPIDGAGLRVTVGDDGPWLHIIAKGGKSAGINMNHYATQQSIGGGAIKAWCSDIEEIANGRLPLFGKRKRPAAPLWLLIAMSAGSLYAGTVAGLNIAASRVPPQPTAITEIKPAPPEKHTAFFYEEVKGRGVTVCNPMFLLQMPVKKGIRYFCGHERAK